MSRPPLFWLPLVLVWGVLKAVALPAALVAVSWWLLPPGWTRLVIGLAVLYLAGVAVYAGAAVRGHLRSMERGTFTIRRRAGKDDDLW